MAEDVMSITPLGSGQEVGRSCHIIEFRNIIIMLDCGIHPGYNGINGLPFLDRIEPDTINVVLITHFHLDHAASLPYLTERTTFNGRIFMTHPTKAVLRLLLGDYIRLLQMKGGGGGSNSADGEDNSDMLYTESELQSCLDKVELIDYHTTITTVDGISFHALNAGHVLGACMYWIEIGGRTILYTGDYSMEDDRHLMAAEIPIPNKPDLLITESTYGVQVHASRAEREARFTNSVERVVTRGGKCLIPVFALGRAQELLLILDEYWSHHHNKLSNIPIYYASKLASRALRVYQTYANMMNARIRQQMDISNPFQFRYIANLKSIDVDNFDDSKPCVVFASPGMLQSGVSRQLFDRWASDPKNGVIIAGYAVEHTLAKEIMTQPKEVLTLEGRRQPLNCLVDYVSFSAHVDFVQNRSFITAVQPKHIILVHGQKDEMGRLKSALLLQYKQLYPAADNKRPTITMPPNLQEVKLKFTRRRSAKVMGTLATTVPTTTTTTTASTNDYDGDNTNDNDNNSTAAMTVAASNSTSVVDATGALSTTGTSTTVEPKEGESVRGILVTHNFQSKIVAPEDLSKYTPLRVGSITSKLHVPYCGSIHTFRLFLNEMFANVRETATEGDNDDKEEQQQQQQSTKDNVESSIRSSSSTTTFELGGTSGHHPVRVVMGGGRGNDGVATVEWEASPSGDVIADSVVALLMHAQSSRASIRLTSQPCRRHPRDNTTTTTTTTTTNNNNNQAPSVEEEDPIAKRQKSSSTVGEVIESRLRLIYGILKDQFKTVEATYEGHRATYEISIDANDDDDANNNNNNTGDDGSTVDAKNNDNNNVKESSSSRGADQDKSNRNNNDEEDNDSMLCTVQAIFEDGIGETAKIIVECAGDEKLAKSIQETLQHAIVATIPIAL